MEFTARLKMETQTRSWAACVAHCLKRRSFYYDKLIEMVFLLLATLSVWIVLSIIAFLLIEALPIFKHFSWRELFLGDRWKPISEQPAYGLLPLILGTLWVTLGALVFSVPLGIGSAIYLAEIAPSRVTLVLKPIIEILAGIPSVVFGFFGLVVLVPLAERVLNLSVGQSALVGSLMLGIMALPTIISVSEDALKSVPRSYTEASLALGATKWHTTSRVVVPAAISGIATSVILGMGRAVGETMTVLMVTGNAAVIPKTFFAPVRTLTATIAAEMGETVQGGVHYSSLFLVGVVLFSMTFVLNMIADLITHKIRMRAES